MMKIATAICLVLMLDIFTMETGGVLNVPNNYQLIENVDSDIEVLKSHIDSKFASLQSEMNAKFASLKSQFTSLHEEVKKCPENSLQFEGSCYFVPLWKAPWDGAQKICERLGGHLVTIESSKENEAITAYVGTVKSKNSQLLNNHFWIGAYDMTKSFYWVWVNGRSFSYNHWQNNWPQAKGGSLRQCANMHPNSKWHNVYKCDTYLHFMCEKEQ